MYQTPRPEARFSASTSDAIMKYPYQTNGWKHTPWSLINVRDINGLISEQEVTI